MNSLFHDESTVIQNEAGQRTGYSALSEESSEDGNVDNNNLDESTKRDRDDNILTTSSDVDRFNFYQEMKELFHIALPTAATQLCSFFVFPQTASIIGRRLPSKYLAAFSLGSLSGNLTCTSIIIGTLSTSETLQPRAFGLKEYREVGILAVRGFVICIAVLLLPVLLLLLGGEDIFMALLGHSSQEDSDTGAAAHWAGAWIRIYVWGVPPLILFRVTQRYLACQNIVLPCLYAAAIGCFCHPIVLRYAVHRYGFLGSAGAVALTQYVQTLGAFYFIWVMKVHEARTWPCWPGSGSSRSFVLEALRWEGLRSYARLSLGGILALTEWWFWETLCFTVGKLGVLPLCVHTIAYQVIPITFMIPLGISIGLSVQMGKLLPVSVDRAKKLAACTMIFTVVVAICVATLLHVFQLEVISAFTSDGDVIEGCNLIWKDLCIHIVIMYIFGINSGILRALGLQWRMAATVISVLWFGGLPTIIFFCFGRGGGLVQMWNILPRLYAVLNFCLSLGYMTANWQEIGDSIVPRTS